MTDMELRVKVAELLGWTHSTADKYRGSANPFTRVWFHSTTSHVGCGFAGVPDYDTDLNACHDMVETLRHTDGPEWHDYQTALLLECGSIMNAIQASPRQRCAAFLKVREQN